VGRPPTVSRPACGRLGYVRCRILWAITPAISDGRDPNCRRFAAPDQMGGGDLIKGSGTPDWPYPGYPTFFVPWVVVTAGGQVKNVGLVMGRPEYWVR
jgi:hypothetical protein